MWFVLIWYLFIWARYSELLHRYYSHGQRKHKHSTQCSSWVEINWYLFTTKHDTRAVCVYVYGGGGGGVVWGEGVVVVGGGGGGYIYKATLLGKKRYCLRYRWNKHTSTYMCVFKQMNKDENPNL